jgi:hypothetical protein
MIFHQYEAKGIENNNTQVQDVRLVLIEFLSMLGVIVESIEA